MEGIHKATELGYHPVKVKPVFIYSETIVFYHTYRSPDKEFIIFPLTSFPTSWKNFNKTGEKLDEPMKK